jgi:hypothetical protein
MNTFEKEHVQNTLSSSRVFYSKGLDELDKTLNSLDKYYGVVKVYKLISGRVVVYRDISEPGTYTVALNRMGPVKIVFTEKSL